MELWIKSFWMTFKIMLDFKIFKLHESDSPFVEIYKFAPSEHRVLICCFCLYTDVQLGWWIMARNYKSKRRVRIPVSFVIFTSTIRKRYKALYVLYSWTCTWEKIVDFPKMFLMQYSLAKRKEKYSNNQKYIWMGW